MVRLFAMQICFCFLKNHIALCTLMHYLFLQEEFANPWHFYCHVAHHVEEFPKRKEKPKTFKCEWEGKIWVKKILQTFTTNYFMYTMLLKSYML